MEHFSITQTNFFFQDCGGVNQESVCPNCKNPIGGQRKPAEGNFRLDKSPVNTIATENERGIFWENMQNHTHFER